MTNDYVPVEKRSSVEAKYFWVRNIENPNITDSFRIIEDNNNLKKKTTEDKVKSVFSLEEIKSFQLPFQRQQQPFEKKNKNDSINVNILNLQNVKINSNSPQKRHYPSPIRIRNSRSIEREVFQRELEKDELCFQDHKRKINEMSQRHKEVLTINKALAIHQQRYYIL